ncbi:nucleoside deaminase [Microbulbifer sp. CnH-101-G]|uniref:nucleoside deaminase n=1 Tax=Microbulbifer sp. CnH-101-G TaxID=3243393 RepID=UPI0040398F55
MLRFICWLYFGIIAMGAQAELQPSSAVQQEKDEILMLLAYSVAYLDWVAPKEKKKRGYNIAAVLYDNAQEKIIGVQRNAVGLCRDKTQHAEVRLMQQCIGSRCRGKETNSLNDTTIYSTLEPCMMCGGMMIFLEVSRVVYGQSDPDFGKNIERLKRNYKSDCKYKFESKQYVENICKIDDPANYRARNIYSEPSDLLHRAQLEGAFYSHRLLFSSTITDFLMSAEAKGVYQAAYQQLMDFKPKYQANNILLLESQKQLTQLESVKGDIDRCLVREMHRH